MKQGTLGSLSVGRIGLGTMPIAGVYGPADDAESIRTVQRAVDLGVTLFDTSDAYGPFVGEEILGRALAGRRDDVVVATKFGLVSYAGGPSAVPDCSPANIRTAVEGSLRRLGTDRIDLYFQHRLDPTTPIEDVVGTLSDLVTEGKVLHLGLSEVWVDTIRRAHAVHPIAAVQSEYSLWTRDQEPEVLPLLRELGAGLVAYSPLGRGFLTGTIRSYDDLPADDWRLRNPRFTADNFEHNLRLADQVGVIAGELGATSGQVALAWLLAKGNDIVPIPGTKKLARLEENAGADSVRLTAQHLATLDAMAPAAGAHHDDAQMRFIER